MGTSGQYQRGTDLQRAVNVVSGIRKRFTVMHELSHYELESEDRGDGLLIAIPSPESLEQQPEGSSDFGAANRQVTAFPIEAVTSPSLIEDVSMQGVIRGLEVLRAAVTSPPFSVQGATRALEVLGAVLRAAFQTVRESAQPQAIKDRVVRLRTSRTMRVRFHGCVLSAEDRSAYVLLMDNLLARFRLEQALRLAAFHRPSVRTIVLILLAVCRCYGRRAGPDDHALLKRRPPTFRGVACTAS
jgi:hypothetical protein